jgi:hypothetical protein
MDQTRTRESSSVKNRSLRDLDNNNSDSDEIDSDLWYMPDQVIGISFLIRYYKGEQLPQDIQYQTISDVGNNKQIEYGLKVFNQARLEHYPYFLYTYFYDQNNKIAYTELLPWINDVNEVFNASPVLRTAIYLQIRQALKWAANKGIYGVSGLKLLLISEDIIVNLPSSQLYSYGYIPFFTDFSGCTTSGNIVDELARYPIDINLSRQIMVNNDKHSQFRLLYPISKNVITSNCARFRYMIESYYNRLVCIYNYYNGNNGNINNNNFWTPVVVAIMKEYSTMITAIGNYCFSDSRIYLDKKPLLDAVDFLSIPQVVNVQEMADWQTRLWMSTSVHLDKVPTIDNYVKGLRYYCYLRTSESVFARVKVPGYNIGVEAKEREMFDILREWQTYLLDTPSNLAAYRALFVGDVEEPSLYSLAYDPLSFDLSHQPVIKPVVTSIQQVQNVTQAPLSMPMPLPIPLPGVNMAGVNIPGVNMAGVNMAGVNMPTPVVPTTAAAVSAVPTAPTTTTNIYPKKVKFNVDINEKYRY